MPFEKQEFKKVFEEAQEKKLEKERIEFLVKNKLFEKRLQEIAKITYKTGHESFFNWMLFKNGKIQLSKGIEGTTDEISRDSEEPRKGMFSGSDFEFKPKKREKVLIYGDIHFHTGIEREKIIPSQADLVMFITIPEKDFKEEEKRIAAKTGKPLEGMVGEWVEEEKQFNEYSTNFWRGTGIVKENKSIDLLLINGRTGPLILIGLYEELDEASSLEEKLSLFKDSGFRVYYFEDVTRLGKIIEEDKKINRNLPNRN